MKKILSLLCLFMLAISSAWAGEVFTFTFTGGKATSVPSEFFTHDTSGKWSFNSKFTGCEYDGVSYSNGLKMEGSTKILFTTTEVSTVTIVQSDWSSNTIKLDGEELAVADATECTGGRVYTVANVAAGDHNITRGSGESGLFLVKVEYADAPKTVTFINDANWTNVNVYAWSGEGDAIQKFTADWPGDALTADAEGNYVWSTMGDPEWIIFNNGTTQTADLPFKDGGKYNISGRIITLNTFTTTFKTDGMDAVWAYAWNSDGEVLGAWPGTPMVGGSGEFTLSFEAEDAPSYIIFNNNAGEQTADLAFIDATTYEYYLNEYTATFTTDANWETVNAYAWSGDGDAAKKFAGEWPGTTLTAAEGVYTFSVKAFNAPEKIIFNNGEDKTPDLAFVNGKAYKWITATPFYALTEGQSFPAGTTVDLGDATITYGASGNDFKAATAVANEDYAGFKFMTEGNNTNGNDAAGTFYIIVPKYDGTITVGVRLNGGKKFHISEDGTDMANYSGITIAEAANTSFDFAVKAGSTYKIWCDGSKLGFFGFDYKFTKPVEPIVAAFADGTYYMVNASTGKKVAANGLDKLGAPLTFAFADNEGYTVTGSSLFADKKWVAEGDGFYTFYTVVEGVKKYAGVNAAEDFTLLDDGTADGAFWILLTPEYWEGTLSYNVAGTADLCGEAWNTTSNPMTKNTETGLYEWKAENITVSHDVKPELNIAVNSTDDQGGVETVAWYPENNWVINPEVTGSEGIFNITITFNNATKEIGVAAEKVDPNDFTKYIVNADLTGEGGFDATGTKGIDGSGIVKVGNAAGFDFKQTIANLPAGQYKLTAQAAYRYGADEQAEYNAIQGGTDTKLVQLYATTSTKTVTAKVMNRWDGASETDYAAGDGSVTVNEKFVPNSSNAVKAWFAAGQYVNEVVFNNVADGDVTIGINRIDTPESDYTVIGPWTLTRIGDAVEEPVELDFTATFTTNAEWADVYAYTWTEGEPNVEQLGAWPGTKLEADAAGVYTANIKAVAAPAKIIFNNGLDGDAKQQTPDLAFEDGKAYEFIGSNATIAEGKYYLYNVAADGFIVGANNWGTRASISKVGGVEMEVVMANGKYELKTAPLYDGKHLGFNGYVDNGDANQNWTVALVDGMDGIYRLSTDGVNVLYWDGGEATTTSVGAMPATAENAYWKLISSADRLALLEIATSDNPIDATFLITNPNFSRSTSNAAWTMEASNQNLQGGKNENKVAESWRASFTLSQALTVPNGVYELNAQAALTEYTVTGEDLAVIYANDATSTFNTMKNGENSMDQMSDNFLAGQYKVDPVFVEVTDGALTIGAKGTRTDTWCVWDNFTLKYYGTEANVDQLKNAELFAKVEELHAQLGALLLSEEVEISAVVSELMDVYNANKPADITTADAANAAIEALTAAIEKGEGYIKAKNVLPKMKQLTESTNVYTAEAYEEYYGQWYQKYEAAELTAAEANALQDPFVTTGWHANITCDNFLLSAWDTNPDFNDAAYYINTWSVEGANDGSNFIVPFFEYWTGDGDSLGEKTLTATMSGLEPGWYEVSSWVRVRAKNGYTAPAYGIKLQANGGDMTNVAAGEQVGDSQFYLATFTAKGEVGEDGVLNIKFIVAADNNISWLSFQNVKYASCDPVEYEYTLVGGYGTEEGAIEDPIFGTTWDPTLSKNNLVKGDDGVYTLSFDDVMLTPGQNILYKVVRSHSWDINWGFNGGNADYYVNQDLPDGKDKGAFDITFKFNPVTPFENGFNVDCVVVYDEAVTTGISGIVREAIENGQVYNLNGQKVMKTQKGLYIVNGRKQVVR